MKKKVAYILCAGTLLSGVLVGCGSNSSSSKSVTTSVKNEVKKDLPTFEQLKTQRPLGGGTLSKTVYLLENDGGSITDTNNTVYYSWNDYKDSSGRTYFLSVFKNGKWVLREKALKFADANYVLNDGRYFIISNDSGKKFWYLKYDESGNVVSKHLLLNIDYHLGMPTLLKPVKLVSGQGNGGFVYYGKNGIIYIITEKTLDHPTEIKVNDINLNNQGNLLYDSINHLLYFKYNVGDTNGLEALNVKTGDPIIDEKGNAKMVQNGDSDLIGSDGKTVYLYTDKDHTIQAFTPKLDRKTNIPSLTLKGSWIDSWSYWWSYYHMATISGDEIHIYNPYDLDNHIALVKLAVKINQ